MSNKHFDIELDRPSGVYYAGEVVTGTMTLQAKDQKCRSLLLSMIGQAKVHWHTGGGDNRTDYDGKKIFLDSERTLLGNFYRTTILDEAGENAIFGGAMGDGDMYIPCLSNEGTNGGAMKLIVRVCDSDWGKKDDNLGEIILDAKELAMHGDAKTFELTRKGKPEKGTVTLAAKFVPTSAINPNSSGQSAQSGDTLVLKVLKAEGLRKADFIGQNDVYVQVWRAPNTLMTAPPVGKGMPEPDMKIRLPGPGMKFKFSFPTRSDSPGSAVVSCGDLAYVAYYIRAEIDKKGRRNPSLKYPITIIPSRPVPMPQLLSPYMIEDEDQIKSMKFCCFACGEAGLVRIKLNSRRAYAPGETLQLSGSEVMNSSSIPVTVRVVLRQTTQLATTGRSNGRTEGSRRFEITSRVVDAGASVRLDDMNAVVPAVPPSFFGANGSSTARRDPLTFTYELSLQAKASSGHKIKVDMPVLISALPAKPQAIQEASTKSNQVPIDSPFEIQNFAVTDDSPCDTVIMATGLEDSGGEVVPSAGGAANIYEVQDAGSSVNYYMYHPQVATFPSTFNNTTEVNDEDNPYVPTSSSGNVEGDHATAYNALTESMKLSYDARLAVDEWIKKYPIAAATLTAAEFAGVLKNVLFSLEQATIARELTSGMGSGVLSTEYILMSIEACPYSKLELVRAMAPYVSDPENKEIVLDELYSFERDKASKLFTR